MDKELKQRLLDEIMKLRNLVLNVQPRGQTHEQAWYILKDAWDDINNLPVN